MPAYPKDDCYETLGVDHEASQDFIHQTFRKLVKIYHPDPVGNARDRAAAEEKLKKITEAYDVLKDAGRRSEYDQWLLQKRQPPKPRVTPGDLDFGTLNRDESRTIRLTVQNDGGPVMGEINFSMARDPSCFRLGVHPSNGFPIVVDVAFDGSAAGDGSDFLDSLTITLDGVAAEVRLRARVRPAPATSSSAPPFSATSHGSGPAGTPPTFSASSPPAPPSSPSGPSRGWAIAIGWIVFAIILFFGQAIAQNAARGRPQTSDWLPGATFYSLFGAAMFAGVMTTGLLQARRKRAGITAALAAASGLTFFILLGVGATGLSRPQSTSSDAPRAIPDVLNRIYAALDDGRVREAAPFLSPEVFKNSQYLCQPFTHRAHYISSITPLNDGSFLARERALFKPFTEKARLLWFKPSASGFILVAARDDPFTKEIEGARESVRQFIFAARAGQWDVVSRYASTHLPITTLKEDAWQSYFAGMTKAEIDNTEIKSDHGIKLQFFVTVKGAGVWAPAFMFDLATGKIVKAFYVVPNGWLTATSGAPSREGIADPDIEHDTMTRFGITDEAQRPGAAAQSQASASPSLEGARRAIPAILDRIYSALNDGQPQEAATALSADIIKSEHDLDYLCQPFTHRAHYVVSIVEEADGTYLARVRALFKPFKERAYVFHFRKSADSFFAYRIQDDSFTQESEAAKDTVRQFISAAKSQDWERVTRYASPHLPIDEMKTPQWEHYLSRIRGADLEGQVRINSDHGAMLEMQFVLGLLEDPAFLVDPTTGTVMRAFYKIGNSFTNAASPPNTAGITDAAIDSYTQARFGLPSSN